jgi:ribosome-associated translation inhibitor RaiA
VRLTDASPAYQVHVHLVTPDPDVFAATRDHTLRAAFTKTIAQLREQITSRASKRLQRLRNNLKGRRGR